MKQKFELPNLLAKKKPLLTKKQIKLTLGTVAFIILVVGFYQGLTLMVNYFRENTIVFNRPITITFQKPVEFISLTELKQRQDMAVIVDQISAKCVSDYFNPPDLTSAPQTNQIDPEVFFDTVWKNETSRGADKTIDSLGMYCQSKGEWNEIGYDPQQKYCFKDRQEAELFVSYFVKKNCDGKTEAQCECFWNTGTWLDQCAYSQGNLSMAN